MTMKSIIPTAALLSLVSLNSFATEKVTQPAATNPVSVPVPETTLETPSVSNSFGVFTSINVGTQGIGMDVGYQFNPHLKARLRGAYLSYDYKDTWDDVAQAKLNYNGSNFGAILDYHPWAACFHVSTGLNLTGMNAKLNVTNSTGIDSVKIGDDTYDLRNGTSIHGRYQWNRVQPYLGVGWSSDGDKDRSFYFSIDLGVNFMGTGKFSVGHTGDLSYTDNSGKTYKASDADIERSVRKEGRDFFKIVDKIWVYPVLQIGVGYRF